MHVTAIVSTKGGVGKTTTAANLGGLAADAGLRVLLLDLDVQPTLSSYYALPQRAPAGCYELLAYNESSRSQLVCRTSIKGLDLSIGGRPVLSAVDLEVRPGEMLATVYLRSGVVQSIAYGRQPR